MASTTTTVTHPDGTEISVVTTAAAAAAEEEEEEEEERDYWVPLESNPEVLTNFAVKIGMSERFAFSDCWGLDPDMLAFQPQPVQAVVFLFPSSKARAFKAEQEEEIKKRGQTVSENVWYMKQLVGNACGTIALTHSLANNLESLEVGEGFLRDFVKNTGDKDPMFRGAQFGKEEGLKAASARAATDEATSTDAPEADAAIDLHFICFTVVDGDLYELDGGKAFPVNHGATTQGDFLNQTVGVIKKNYIEKMPDEHNFVVLTLGPPRE